MKTQITITAFTLSLLIGCSSQQDQPQGNIALPGWVVAPSIENGLADSACVPWSGHLTIDREQATAMARNALVRQIELKAANMSKTYAHKTDTVSGSNIGATFETSARQIAEATLQGTKAVKADLFRIEKQQQLCVLVTLEPQNTSEVFEQIVQSSGATLSSTDEKVLFEEFKAWKAHQELEQALEKQ